jgi:hypothetical protein
MVHHTPYITEEIFSHKHVEEDGGIIEIRILKVPKTEKTRKGSHIP